MSGLHILKKDEVYQSLRFPYFPSIYGRHFTVGSKDSKASRLNIGMYLLVIGDDVAMITT